MFLGERNKGQKAASNSRPRPITLAPDPSHSRTLASDSPNRTSPLRIGLVRDPFMTQRRSPSALNLSRKRPLVTKRRPLLGGRPRRRLFAGRRLMRNPFSQRSRNAVATVTKTRAGVPPSAKDAPRQRTSLFRRSKPKELEKGRSREAGERQQPAKREILPLVPFRPRAGRQPAPQTKTPMPSADRRKLPRTLLGLRCSKREMQTADRQRQPADRLKSKRPQGARRRFLGLPMPGRRSAGVREQGVKEKEVEKARPPREDRQIQRPEMRREDAQLVTQQREMQQADPRRLDQQ